VARKKQPVDLATLDVDELFGLANEGNEKALELLHERYRENPNLARTYGDLEWSARERRLKQMLGGSAPGTALAVRKKMQDIVTQVAGENPTPLERLLAKRVAMCWLDVQDHEHRYSDLGNDTLTKYEWRSRMLDRAHKRYLSAIKALAVVRKLGLPAIQVNIGEKQMNLLAQSTTTPREKAPEDTEADSIR
jgi:hypothetical protein